MKTYTDSTNKGEIKMKKKKRIIAILAAFIILTVTLTGCSGLSRELKTIGSDFSGGLNRTVTVYDNHGNVIKEYSGKIDVETSENKVLFDLNGKRTIIYNATVIVQEN